MLLAANDPASICGGWLCLGVLVVIAYGWLSNRVLTPTQCTICGNPLRKCGYHWETNGRREVLCRYCNERAERRNSREVMTGRERADGDDIDDEVAVARRRRARVRAVPPPRKSVARPASATVITPDAVAAAESAFARARDRWERLGRPEGADANYEAAAEDVKGVESDLADAEDAADGDDRRVRAMRAVAAALNALGLGDGEWWVLSLAGGILGVVGVGSVLLAAGAAVKPALVVAAFAFVGGTAVALVLLYPLCERGVRGRIERIDRVRAEKRRFAVECRRWLLTNRAHRDYLKGLADAESEYRTTKAALEELRRGWDAERYRLQTTNWADLRSVPFEQFLAAVFRLLGYTVETTKASGDQGVDLIVTGGGRRVAVQAKGYGNPVGNSSVQEAHTGMTFYRCGSAVVVTNNRFTPAAEQLAAAVGCKLIDGSMIPALIQGRLSTFPPLSARSPSSAPG
jgi:restriction system protein